MEFFEKVVGAAASVGIGFGVTHIDADFDQLHILPPSIEDWVGPTHPARFICCFVESLDLMDLGIEVRDFGTAGRPPFAPALLLRLWLYGYFKKIRSSRKLEEACRNDLGFIWLCGNQVPDHNTLWRFWSQHQKAIRNLFKQSVTTSCEMGLVGLTLQAVDGTKIQAAAHAGKKYDKEDLAKRIERLDEQIKVLEEEIERSQAGDEQPSAELPKELEKKEVLKKAMQEAIETLDTNPTVKHIHPLEPEARRVKANTGGKPFGYNAQAVVDSENQIVVAADAVNEATDLRQLTPMLDQAAENLATYQQEQENDGKPASQPVSLGDAGYPSAEQIGLAEEAGHEVVMPLPPQSVNKKDEEYHASNFVYDAEADVVTCPQGQSLPFRRERVKEGVPVSVYRGAPSTCKNCPAFGACTKDRHGRTIDISPWNASVERHKEKMNKEENKELLKQRAGIVEPVFGQIKKNGEFWRWTFKGLEKVRTQWMMLCTSWNLKVMYRHWMAAQNAPIDGTGKQAKAA